MSTPPRKAAALRGTEPQARAARSSGRHRRPTRRLRRFFILAVLSVALVAGALFGAGALLAGRLERSFPRATLLAPEARAERPAAPVLTGPLNYLLIGSDERRSNPAMGARSDTIIVMHVPRSMDRVVLVSIPRDLLVDIPPYPPTGFPGERTKINAAFQYGRDDRGGARLLSETLTRVIGVRFDGAVVVNFRGLREAVRVLGGVRLCVDVRTVSIHTGAVFRPGCRRMSPSQVLDYLRQRETLPDGDHGRQRHQQQFLKAVLAEALTQRVMLNPVRANRLVKVLSRSMVLDTGRASVPEMIFALRDVRPDRLLGLRLPTYDAMINGVSYLVGEQPAADGLFRAIRTDTLEEWAAAHPDWVNRI